MKQKQKRENKDWRKIIKIVENWARFFSNVIGDI